MSTNIDKALDFSESKTDVSKPTYRYKQITPISSGGSIPVASTTQTVNLVFEVPSSVVNLSKTYLTFDLSEAKNAHFAHYYMTGKSLISTIAIQDRSGQYLMNIPNNANNFYFTTSLVTTPFQKHLQSDIPVTQITTALLDTTCSGLKRTSASDPTPTKLHTSGDNAVHCIRYQICLGDLPYGLTSLNKDLYFGQILTLTIGLAPSNRIGFISDLANGTTGLGTLGAAPVFSNVYLQLCTEVDEKIVQSIMNKVNSTSMSINIPYVQSFVQNNANATTSSSLQVRLNSGYGQRLLKVFHSFMNSVETGSTAFTPCDVTDFEIRTSLDNRFLSDNALRQRFNEPYMFLKSQLEGSSILNSTDFANWFFYLDNFSSNKPIDYAQESVIDGIPLDNELLYGININCDSQTFVQYLYAVVQRTLTISGSQIMLR